MTPAVNPVPGHSSSVMTPSGARAKSVRIVFGLAGSGLTLWVLWTLVLGPLEWPPLGLVGRYTAESFGKPDTYLHFAATAVRAALGMLVGFGLAVVLGLVTGRSTLGWVFFFFLLLFLQKIPAVAMVHVYVSSRLGIGTLMTVCLSATVVLTFTWLVIHHRASTLDRRETFALRVTGLRGPRLALFGIAPHLGSVVGSSARLAAAISIVITIIGEWQGVWDDGGFWSHGLGVAISRAYESIDSEARVLAACLWLGALGVLADGGVHGMLWALRRLLGIDFQR